MEETQTNFYKNVLESNAKTEKSINRNKASHKCKTCGTWFENNKMFSDKCDNCKK